MKIEILSVDLLKNESNLVEQFRHLSLELEKGLGWHYLLDLTWAASQLSSVSRMSILDAGAGIGLMQWWLADQGIDVISVDRMNRYELSNHYRNRYRLKGWRRKDLAPVVSIHDFLPPRSLTRWHLYPQKLIGTGKKLFQSIGFGKRGGTIYIYNNDLRYMTDIPDESVDAIVSISALEHNSPEKLRVVVAELMRVLKPGGKLIATLGSAKEQDWFHEPSKGWCYTEATLRSIFDLSADCPSNYEQYDELYQALRNCLELRDNLADFYSQSGENGMPWGIWDPKYQTVGIVKVKAKR